MKTIEELEAVKAKMQNTISVRTSTGAIRIAVGMGDCGAAAGAHDVLNAFVEGVFNGGLSDHVIVTMVDCADDCKNAPVVTVCEKGKETVTYVNMTAARANEVIEKHIKGGKPVTEYTVAKN